MWGFCQVFTSASFHSQTVTMQHVRILPVLNVRKIHRLSAQIQRVRMAQLEPNQVFAVREIRTTNSRWGTLIVVELDECSFTLPNHTSYMYIAEMDFCDALAESARNGNLCFQFLGRKKNMISFMFFDCNG